MHQAVRVSTKKRGSGSPGPGAQADTGGVLDILRLLDEGGFDLRTAGGSDLDAAGMFTFSVRHDESASPRDAEARAALQKEGYDARLLDDLHVCVVDDEQGALRRCLEEMEASNGPIAELHVGTAETDGRIPVQVITRAAIARADGAA